MLKTATAKTTLVRLEPGDMTRYEFQITPLDKVAEKGVVSGVSDRFVRITFTVPHNGTVDIIASLLKDLTTGSPYCTYIMDKTGIDNSHSVCVVARAIYAMLNSDIISESVEKYALGFRG